MLPYPLVVDVAKPFGNDAGPNDALLYKGPNSAIYNYVTVNSSTTSLWNIGKSAEEVLATTIANKISRTLPINCPRYADFHAVVNCRSSLSCGSSLIERSKGMSKRRSMMAPMPV